MGKIFNEANMEGFIEVKSGLDFLDKQVHIGDEVVMPAKDSFICGKVIKIYKYVEYEDDSYYIYFVLTDGNRETIKNDYLIIKV